MASTSNQGPNPNRGRKRRRPSTAAVVAGTVGKVLGTFLLICVITGVILLCFAAVYIKTVIIPQAHLEANFVMNQTSTIYYKDSTTGNMWSTCPSMEQKTANWSTLRRSQII